MNGMWLLIGVSLVALGVACLVVAAFQVQRWT